MTIAAPAALRRVNPVTRLFATLLLAIVLIASVDVVSAGVALAATLLLLAAIRAPWRQLLLRSTPLLIAAPLAALTIALYGRASGTVHLAWGPILVTDGSLRLAAATLLRVLAIGVPSIALFFGVDATELADGLAQVVRLPARFVLGALAAFRLFGLFAEDWRSLGLARRARGIADSGRIRRTAGQAFALLVLAVRRATDLATAMEARGFGSEIPRTWARPSTLGRADAAFLAVIVGILSLAVGVSLLTGAWNPIFSGHA